MNWDCRCPIHLDWKVCSAAALLRIRLCHLCLRLLRLRQACPARENLVIPMSRDLCQGQLRPRARLPSSIGRTIPQNLGNQIRGDVYADMQQRDIAARRSNAAPIGAVILIVLGALFLLDNIGLWHFNFDRFWPLILIAIGIWLLIRRLGLLESHGKEQR